MNITPTLLLKTATYVLTLAVGGLLLIAGSQQADLSTAQQRITKLEADVRTATGKYLDLGETHSDELEAARSERSMEIYGLQIKLDACTAAKK